MIAQLVAKLPPKSPFHPHLFPCAHRSSTSTSTSSPLPPTSHQPSSTHPGPQPPHTPLTTKNAHNPKPRIKQTQRIRHKAAHTPHPPHGAKHAAATIRTPHNRQRTAHVPAQGIHGRHHAHQTRQHEGQQTVTQHARAAGEREGGIQVAEVVGVGVSMVGRGRRMGMRGGFVIRGRGHEGEDGVEG